MKFHYSELIDGEGGILEYRYVPDGDEKFYITVVGDRLDVLSYKFYGTPELWWYIAIANGLRNAFELEPGTKILIPKINKI